MPRRPAQRRQIFGMTLTSEPLRASGFGTSQRAVCSHVGSMWQQPSSSRGRTVILDQSPGNFYSSVVRGKSVHKGKTTTYSIDIDPWGPIVQPSNLRISRETFTYISKGDSVHLTLHTGALGVPWYYMSSWDRPG